MRRAPGIALLFCSCLRLVVAQPAQVPVFDAVSLKPSPPPPAGDFPPLPSMQGGPGTPDPTRISYRNVPLPWLINQAYTGSVVSQDVVGPAWATTPGFMGSADKFDIEATLPSGTSQEQFQLMLQNLLAERFAFKAHRERKEVPAYALEPVKRGPKLKESPAVPDGTETNTAVNASVLGDDGFRATPPGYSGNFVNVQPGHTRVKFIRISMAEFAKWTRVNSKRPGIDRTGLTARYDFYLEYSNDIPGAADQADVFSTALQKQLGLKLVPDKTEIDLLVIDHIDRGPTGN